MFRKARAINIDELLKGDEFELNNEYNFFDRIKYERRIQDKCLAVKSTIINSFERAKYGVSSRDAWSLGDYILVSVANGLRMLARDTHGWPGSEEFPKFEDWQFKLLEVAEQLESTTSEHIENIADKEWKKYVVTKDIYGSDSEETQKAHDIWWAALELEQNNIKQTRKEAFEWIAEHCDHLWD